MPGRTLVLSDMHFGTPQSSVNAPVHRDALVAHVVSRAPWKEIVFTGDLLDANLSTLTQAIEGRRRRGPEVFGFRRFLEDLDGAARNANGSGLKDVAERWVYVPGNHDYKIWDQLASRLALDDVLARGEKLGSVRIPVERHRWADGSSFFAGVFLPFGVSERVSVAYPNHEATFGAAGDTMVFTHGHYLDPSQTRGNDLAAHLSGDLAPRALADERRRIFVETAQVQAVASAVSFTRDTQHLVGDLVGPDGLVDKLRKIGASAGAWILRVVFARDGSLRGESLSRRQLDRIDAYLDRFCCYAPRPRWFVFGHTHRQGRGLTPGGVEVWNAGSCYPDGGLPITFLEIDVRTDGTPAVQLMCVDEKGDVRPSPLDERRVS